MFGLFFEIRNKKEERRACWIFILQQILWFAKVS